MATRIPRPPADDLRRLYIDERLSFAGLAARYHVSEGTVRVWLRETGTSRRVPGWARRVGAGHLRALYEGERLTIAEIAARERVSANTVWRALEHHRIPRRPWGRTLAGEPPAVSELRRRYLEDGWPIRQLAAHAGISYATTRGRLLAAGVPLRPPGRQRHGAGRAAR